MLEFMVLAAPRSGTTWAANWLTTETLLCLHDPVLEHHPEDLDRFQVKRGTQLGVSCSALALLPDFVNAHPARKVVLHRPFEEINLSLLSIGLTPLDAKRWDDSLTRIKGWHLHWDAMFDTARAAEIYEHLTKRVDFSVQRHSELVKMYVEPAFERVPITDRAKSFRDRVRSQLQ